MDNSPYTAFQKKVSYFHIFNACFSLWALLATVYYIVNTININCSKRISMFIQFKITS